MSEWLVIVFGVMMVAAALFAVHTKSLLGAVVVSGAVSLMASVIYLLLHAPDAAMTEAAIGSGLTTVVFLYTLKRVFSKKDKAENG